MTSQQSDPPDDSNSPTAPSFSEPPQANLNHRFPVVGIGASAGGLEAFTQLLNHLPIDTGMAFVLVQHLDPNQKSLLSEILSRTTRMPVSEVQEGMAVEPNHVYVIPPNTLMTVAQGALHLTPRDRAQKVSKAIDMFFNSLAVEYGEKAIAVILSGGDADGTQGLEAIKAEGGITFAQSQESAQVTSMPNTAIATGQVDFILSPEEIATELANISRHPYVTTPTLTVLTEASPEGRDALSTIFGLLRTAVGVDFSQYKHTTIQRRIFRRMALYRLEKLTDYVRYLQETPAEVQALYQEILIHVTSFFRDASAFETLKREVFPILLRDRPAESPIRVWVAGCSTGEEAYSIAICLLEFLAHQPRQPQIQIFATDVSERAIEKARLGIYLSSQVADVSPDRLQRFFVPLEGSYQINKTVRELCVFARQNLISDPPFSRMDLISCRNVLIYFGAPLQKKVLPMFHYGLKPTGFLMLGSSETVGGFSNLFHLVDRKHKIYAKQPTSRLSPLDLGSASYPETVTPAPVHEVRSREASLSERVDQIVLNQYAPVGVVVTDQLDIVQFRGQTGDYLAPSPGQASLNVLNMVKEELRLDLRTAIHQAKQDGKAVRKEGIPLRTGEQTWQVRIDVVPIKSSAANDDHFLILFGEMIMPPTPRQDASPTDRKSAARKKPSQEQAEILRLQQELETTKTYLRSIIEEQQSTNQDLRAANEEILSSNEELQSTNEELQTAKEEIQATNEELGTINDELYRRNAETMQVSNDFQNLLGSINIPIIMLEADLRIRRFTPTAATLFNLIPADIGRPLSDIKHNLTIADLEAQILEVINTLTLKTQEVQDQAGHWYDLRIRPYRTLDNRIDGAVVVLVEIDALKRTTDQLRDARDYAEAIVQTIRDSLLVLNADLQVVTANQRFYATFQVTPSETENVRIFDLGNGQWNIPQLRSLLEDLLPNNIQIDDFQVEHGFEHIGRKNMRLNARKMSLNQGEQLILLAIEDVSDWPNP
ncbi:MAG TPA: chemotaxis protein CheB [Coleofasciculaceae cyanobacterium]